MNIGDKVRVFPKVWDERKKEWTFKGNKKHPYHNKIGTIRSLGVIPTVYFLANTNVGYYWMGVDYDEMEVVPKDTELSVM